MSTKSTPCSLMAPPPGPPRLDLKSAASYAYAEPPPDPKSSGYVVLPYVLPPRVHDSGMTTLPQLKQ